MIDFWTMVERQNQAEASQRAYEFKTQIRSILVEALEVFSNTKNCTNCRWVGCNNYGRDYSACGKYIKSE